MSPIKCAYIIGFSFLYVIIAAFPISWVMYLMEKNVNLIDKIENSKKTDDLKSSKGWFLSQWQVSIVGIIERFLYLTSILVLKPEFIALWLTIKTVYLSLSEKNVSGRRIYNNFLIGNGLSIFYAFAGAGIIQWATGPILPNTTSIIFMTNNYLLWFSIVSPIVLSLFFVGILYRVSAKLNKISAKIAHSI